MAPQPPRPTSSRMSSAMASGAGSVPRSARTSASVFPASAGSKPQRESWIFDGSSSKRISTNAFISAVMRARVAGSASLPCSASPARAHAGTMLAMDVCEAV